MNKLQQKDNQAGYTVKYTAHSSMYISTVSGQKCLRLLAQTFSRHEKLLRPEKSIFLTNSAGARKGHEMRSFST
jgi:hypothetical protein